MQTIDLGPDQRRRVEGIAFHNGWTCPQCGTVFASTGVAFRTRGAEQYRVGLRCTNADEAHPEGREPTSRTVFDDEARELGIPAGHGVQPFRMEGSRFPHAPR